MAQLKLAEAAAQRLMEKHFSLGTFGLLARAWLFHRLRPLFGGARVRVFILFGFSVYCRISLIRMALWLHTTEMTH